jgi:mono/diheme cytochrome c family protein
MVNAIRCAKATISLMLVVVVSGCVLPAVNLNAAVNETSGLFPDVITLTPGQERYSTFCAGCHGPDGRGKGHSSRYCTVPPADLTQLAQKNNGIYPAEWVLQVLRHGTGQPPKGRGYMPIWEPLLKSMKNPANASTEVQIRNLTEYVKTLQDDPSASQKRPAALR